MNKSLIYYFFSSLTVSLALALALVPLMRTVFFKLGTVDRGREGEFISRYPEAWRGIGEAGEEM